MQLQVTAVTKNPRTFNGKISWGVKDPNGAWYSFYRGEAPVKGDTFEVIVKENQGKNGQVYRDAFPARLEPPAATVQASSNGNGNGKYPWEDIERLAAMAHRLAMTFEPDGPDPEGPLDKVISDRSQARASILNTIITRFCEGKIALPKDELPPLTDEDMPPWER